MAIGRARLIACRFAKPASTLSDLERRRAFARASARGVAARHPDEPGIDFERAFGRKGRTIVES
jgi:hypothetical protein